MPRFPTSEAQIVALADRMFKGYQRHPMDFPHVAFVFLIIASGKYRQARQKQIEARATERRAATDRRHKLHTLVRIMKECLKKACVDVADDPKKMSLLGYAVTDGTRSLEPPNCPRNLTAVCQENNKVKMHWDKPVKGGSLDNYLIERRAASEEMYGPVIWQLVETIYDTQIELTDQPTSVTLEYRVVAANKSGKSNPSNVITVRL